MYKLIIVDDELFILNSYTDLIDAEQLGVTIEGTYTDGLTALDHIKNNPTDIVLTDIKMPFCDGIDIAKYCYENFKATKVILVSAYRDFEYAQSGIKYNVVEYLSKPFSKDELNNVIKKAIGEIEKKEDNINEEETIFSGIDLEDNEFLKNAEEYIKNNYTKDITVDDASREFHLNKSYFCALYKKYTNETFADTLRRLRLKKACELLEEKNVKVSMIHLQVGYNSRSYFNKIFKSNYGMTLEEYRKNNIKKD